MDELEFEELSVEIDDRLGVELEEGWYSEVKTMGQLMEYLEKNLAA
jgi:acyl carrier protein